MIEHRTFQIMTEHTFAFSQLSGDYNPLHIDREAARMLRASEGIAHAAVDSLELAGR